MTCGLLLTGNDLVPCAVTESKRDGTAVSNRPIDRPFLANLDSIPCHVNKIGAWCHCCDLCERLRDECAER